MNVSEEASYEKECEKEDEKETIFDLSKGVIYFGTPTSAEKRLHTMQTPPRHVSSRRKTVLLPSKVVLYSSGNSNQQDGDKEKKSRRQSYLYATKSSVTLEQQRLQEMINDRDAEFYSNNLEKKSLFTEAPGSVERKIKKRKSDVGKLLPTLSAFQKRTRTSRRFSIFNTVTPRSISTISRRRSTSSLLLQRQNKSPCHTFEKEIKAYEIPIPFCIKIQAFIRGYLIRKSILHQNRAVKIIQRKYLTILIRRKFLLARKSAIIIQSAWRGWVERMRYLEMIEACICIQKWWRQLSQGKKAKNNNALIRTEEKETTKNISSNSSLEGFLKKWESKKALVAATKNKDIKKNHLSKEEDTNIEEEVKKDIPLHSTEESLSQKTNIPVGSSESPKLSKKISKPKNSISHSKSSTSMTLMLKQSISLSTARILSNPTNSISSTNTNNSYTSFQNRSRLPRSKLTGSTLVSKTTVLSDISPNSLREDTIEILSTPIKNKLDGISTGALRVSSPSPQKNAYFGSPFRKVAKKNQSVFCRKTALLVPQNIKALHSSQTVSENISPKKNSNSFLNNGLGSPSRQKVVNQTDFFTFRNSETNNEERTLYNRSKTIDSKALSTSTLQPHTPTVKHNTICQNLSTPYRSLNYLTLGEITKMTRQNTYQNRIYRCDFNRVIIRKNQVRPPSPTAKSQSKLAAEARLKRKKLQKEKIHDYTLGPGDDDNWVPKELTPLKKGVKWDKLLESELGQSISNYTLEKPDCGKIKSQKGCLSKKVHMIRLDDLGNVLDAREPLTPIIGKAETVIIQKFLYRGEEDE